MSKGETPQPQALSDERMRRLEAMLSNLAPVRVQRLRLDGKTYWVKRPEHLSSLRWRLQKGDPRRAFAADLDGLRHLTEQDVPAPAVLHVARNWFVTEDAGQPLDDLLRQMSDAEGARLAAAAATTLARLHQTGARHGRPKLRDICWDGRTARLIDLERFRSDAGVRAMGLDWAILLHSLLETTPSGGRSFASAVRAYRGSAPAAAVAAGTRLIRHLGRTRPLLDLALWARPGHVELAAARRLPDAFAAI
jgi:tRNA A-37 threonylcarbamoyl transferase component Bud32